MSPASSAHIVVGYDFSPAGRAALYRAIGVAKRAPFHVLHFVCVIDPHTPFPQFPSTTGVDYKYAVRVQEAIIDEVAIELGAANVVGHVHFFVHARIGKAVPEILDVCRQVGASLIMVGSHGLGGLRRFVLGSVSERIVREAQCTVEVARANGYKPVDEIAETEAYRGLVPPARYSYEDHAVKPRPLEWPFH